MEDYGLKRVVDVEYLHDYVMKLEFNNGDVRLVDFDPLLHGKFYDELRDKRNFVQFGLTSLQNSFTNTVYPLIAQERRFHTKWRKIR